MKMSALDGAVAEPYSSHRSKAGGFSAARLARMHGTLLFWEPAHWIMQTRQFANLKRRA